MSDANFYVGGCLAAQAIGDGLKKVPPPPRQGQACGSVKAVSPGEPLRGQALT